jgi:hypothetical protein
LRFRLPMAPAKLTDRRAFDGVGDDPTATVEAEALTPAQLADIVETAIRAYWNEAAARRRNASGGARRAG